MIKKRNITYLFLVFSLYILCFQYFLENQISILKYIDEFYAFLFIPVVLFKFKSENKFVLKENNKLIILIIVLIILGLIPNIIYKYQSIGYVVMDIVLFLKFFFVVGLSGYLFKNEIFNENNNKKLMKHMRFIILVLLFATIINYLFKVWPNSNVRFGIMTNQIFFGHPTKLSAVLFFLLAFYNLVRKGKSDIFYLFIYIMIFTTLRMKALLALGLSLIIMFYVKNKNNKINVRNLAIMGLIACAIGFSTFKFYFMSDGFARTELLRTSFKIASDYFPLGTGFGTFGSWPSGVSYSPIYYMYGVNNVWGITPYDYSAIADSFWPTVLGQFGYIGLLLYIIIIGKIFSNIQKEYNSNYKYVYCSKLIAYLYLLVSSTSESAFFNPLAIPLGIIIGLNFLSQKKENKKDESNI